MKSHSEAIELLKLRDKATPSGASGEVAGICDEEPICMHMTVLVSAHAANNGSHFPE
jgi:hypothetical protein